MGTLINQSRGWVKGLKGINPKVLRVWGLGVVVGFLNCKSENF